MPDSRHATCPVCRSTRLDRFFDLPNVPVHANLLWPARARALDAPRGDIRLAFCQECGHIFNTAFDPARMVYTEQYENSLHFSPRFQDYARGLAERLVERYDLHGVDIVEIGSGQGDFLSLLCELGGNRGVGFDPSYTGSTGEKKGQPVRIVKDYYSERYAGIQAHLIVSRHTLEHLEKPRELAAMLRRAIVARPTVVFFEVPNALFTLRGLSIWDLIYEHVSYFTPASLRRLFSAAGFDVLEMSETYGGQFLTIEARPAANGRPPVVDRPAAEIDALHADVRDFVTRYQAKMSEWSALLEDIRRAGRRAVVWGAGSKGVTFLNMLAAGAEIEYVVDINPRKHGMYVAGSGQQIVPPAAMRDYCPDVIVLMNPIYRQEVENTARGLGLKAEIMQA